MGSPIVAPKCDFEETTTPHLFFGWGTCPTTPTPAPRQACGGLRAALLANSPEQVKKVLEMDESLAWMPITDSKGCESPAAKAARFGCCPDIFELLERHGAPLDMVGRGRMTLLAILAGAEVEEPAEAGTTCHLGLGASVVCLAGAAGGMPDLWSDVLGMDQARTEADEESRLASAVWLLRRGADAEHQDESGRTAAGWAEETSRPRMASFLRYRRERSACRLLRARELRPATSGASPAAKVLSLPLGVQELMYSFLVPGVPRA